MKQKNLSDQVQVAEIPGVVPTKRAKRNVKKQDELVSALYKFSEGIQDNPHNCRYGENMSRSIHLASVDKALEDIMQIFGYEVTPIE